MVAALCPGSFDPITNGHLDVFERAAGLFDEVVVTVTVNPSKRGMFSPQERMELIAEATGHLGNVRAASWQGLLVDFAREQGIGAIVKGLRSAADFDYELPMAQMNRRLTGVDTVFVIADPAHACLSSSLVKEVAALGGDVRGMLPQPAYKRLMERLAQKSA
jgi:pantetheine-phosphate adenylyltransferase